MFLQEEGEETKAPRAKPNDVEWVVETSAESPHELGILLDSRDTPLEQNPERRTNCCSRCLWIPSV